MAKVFCALPAFEALPDVLPTPGAVATDFLNRIDPALAEEGCLVEVYRLQRVGRDERLNVGDQLLCRIPDWPFDMDCLNQMQGELEDTKAQLAELSLQFERAAATLAVLGATGAAGAALAQATAASDAAEAPVEVESSSHAGSRQVPLVALSLASSGGAPSPNTGASTSRGRGARCPQPPAPAASLQSCSQEVQSLRRQLAERDAQLAEEKQTQQKLRDDLIALREHAEYFMHLLTPAEAAVAEKRTHAATAAALYGKTLSGHSPDVGPCSRFRAAGSSPQTVRSSPGSCYSYGRGGAGHTGVRPGMRPRSVQSRSGGSGGGKAHHSAGPPSLRHRRLMG
eukprot:gb/GFBE01029439.1/.p1 GENE.gb/GFBE01029439.1/~~gb/GFBE01029439.1/.p1  ORF type:complete len:340 (+),score=34.25 gb/GFBE01029439.1/:1-1020(+)